MLGSAFFTLTTPGKMWFMVSTEFPGNRCGRWYLSTAVWPRHVHCNVEVWGEEGNHCPQPNYPWWTHWGSWRSFSECFLGGLAPGFWTLAFLLLRLMELRLLEMLSDLHRFAQSEAESRILNEGELLWARLGRADLWAVANNIVLCLQYNRTIGCWDPVIPGSPNLPEELQQHLRISPWGYHCLCQWPNAP